MKISNSVDNLYWQDKNGNKWLKNEFGIATARNLSDSLIECYNCLNCDSCSYCKRCVGCTDCYKVTDSLQAFNCYGCDFIRNSHTLVNCNNAIYCDGLLECMDSKNCREGIHKMRLVIKKDPMWVAIVTRKRGVKVPACAIELSALKYTEKEAYKIYLEKRV